MYHAIIVDKSLKDAKILDGFTVLNSKKSGDWTLYKIEVSEDNLDGIILTIQENMDEGKWYFHFYNEDGSKLVIVYKSKVFYADKNIENWKDAIDYGESLGIPKEQLDFSPNTFVVEKY